jgi:Cytochrome b5-like Heme/Steroid binding domain
MAPPPRKPRSLWPRAILLVIVSAAAFLLFAMKWAKHTPRPGPECDGFLELGGSLPVPNFLLPTLFLMAEAGYGIAAVASAAWEQKSPKVLVDWPMASRIAAAHVARRESERQRRLSDKFDDLRSEFFRQKEADEVAEKAAKAAKRAAKKAGGKKSTAAAAAAAAGNGESGSGQKPAGDGSAAGGAQPYFERALDSSWSGRVFTKRELAQFHGGPRGEAVNNKKAAGPKDKKDAASEAEEEADVLEFADLPWHDDPDFTKDSILLAIMGEVFEVTKGAAHYARGSGGYGFFAGRDASRSFVTGEFKGNGLREDLDGLTPEQVLGVLDWVKFYHESYDYVGRLNGHFFDAEGKPKAAIYQAQKAAEQAIANRAVDTALSERFPPCNSRWSQNEGGEFWCSVDSGGINRKWIGVVRHLQEPGHDARCACVSPEDEGYEHAELMPGCGPKDIRCKNTLVDAEGKPK